MAFRGILERLRSSVGFARFSRLRDGGHGEVAKGYVSHIFAGIARKDALRRLAVAPIGKVLLHIEAKSLILRVEHSQPARLFPRPVGFVVWFFWLLPKLLCLILIACLT